MLTSRRIRWTMPPQAGALPLPKHQRVHARLDALWGEGRGRGVPVVEASEPRSAAPNPRRTGPRPRLSPPPPVDAPSTIAAGASPASSPPPRRQTVACIQDLQRGALSCRSSARALPTCRPSSSSPRRWRGNYLRAAMAAAAPVRRDRARERAARRIIQAGAQVSALRRRQSRRHGGGIYLDGIVLDEYADMDPARGRRSSGRARDRIGLGGVHRHAKGRNNFFELLAARAGRGRLVRP